MDNIIQLIWEKNIDFCICWSGKRFADCCKVKLHDVRFPNAMRERFVETTKKIGKMPPDQVKKIFWKCNTTGNKCIELGCQAAPIWSHIFSRKHIYDNFWSVLLSQKYDEEWLLRRVEVWADSKNIKYPLRCPTHDSSLFRISDKNQIPLDPDAAERHVYEYNYKTLWRDFFLSRGAQRFAYSSLLRNVDNIDSEMIERFRNTYFRFNAIATWFERFSLARTEVNKWIRLEYNMGVADKAYKQGNRIYFPTIDAGKVILNDHKNIKSHFPLFFHMIPLVDDKQVYIFSYPWGFSEIMDKYIADHFDLFNSDEPPNYYVRDMLKDPWKFLGEIGWKTPLW